MDVHERLRKPVKLLIVDDEIQIREGLRDLVDWKSLGVDEIRDAEDGRAALLEFTTYKPDIVLTDVVMTQVDGIELIRTIRKTSSRTRIILMSAFQDLEFIKSAFKYDALDYLFKPMRTEELHDVIKKAVSSLYSDREGPSDMSDSNATGESDHATDEKRIIHQIRKFIDANYYRSDLSIQTIADGVCLSPNYLCRIFKNQTGSTVHEHLIRRRHQEAKLLLKETNHRIRDIARGIGYSDANYFAKCFRRIEGCTPTQYRDSR